MSDSTGWDAGIQVRADFLRGEDCFGDTSMFPRGGMPPLATGAASSRKRRSWRAHDLKRALAAARKSGLQRYRVEIAPDGTISIVVGLEERRGRR